MFDSDTYKRLEEQVAKAVKGDGALLSVLREEIRTLQTAVHRIHPRSTTSVSLVATDGGNNRVQFDPFLIQVVRVVDSSDNEYCLDVVTPSTDITELSQQQFCGSGPLTPLGYMMDLLGVKTLPQLSRMIHATSKGEPVSPSWVQVYRELVEWSILLKIVREQDFATDTLIVWDGLLRSKVFARPLFQRYRQCLVKAIDTQWQKSKRRIYVAGVAKHSRLMDRYRLAMLLEDVLTNDYPCYVEIPREIEEKAYRWSEYARGDDRALENVTEINNMVAGKMFLVKFGSHPRDPVWPVDILLEQASQAQAILGYMLADAINGFPIPSYPRCLQKAHENAALVDFDFDILEDQIHRAIREMVESRKRGAVDVLRMRSTDLSRERYQQL